MHTLLDLHGNIPTFIRITDGKVHDVNMLDEIVPEAGAFYVMDRGYIDFERLYVFSLSSAFFVVRTKHNVVLQRRYSRPVDKSLGLRSDHTVILTAIESVKAYPDALRRVNYFDAETNQRLGFLTNNFTLPAITIAQIYKCRWQVELFKSATDSTVCCTLWMYGNYCFRGEPALRSLRPGMPCLLATAHTLGLGAASQRGDAFSSVELDESSSVADRSGG
jgi:hypothetical protein